VDEAFSNLVREIRKYNKVSCICITYRWPYRADWCFFRTNKQVVLSMVAVVDPVVMVAKIIMMTEVLVAVVVALFCKGIGSI
jgi:hypothetical protein